MAKYRIDATCETVDGSGNLAWVITALDDADQVISGMTTTVLTPFDEVQIALDDPNPGEALLELLGAYAPPGWLPTALDDRVAANADAKTAKDNIDALIPEYPYEFEV